MPRSQRLVAGGLCLLALWSAALLAACGSNADEDGPPWLETPAANDDVRDRNGPGPTQEPIVGLDGAQQALRDGRFEAAAAAFEQFAAESDDADERANGYLGAGVAWHEAGNTARAIEALRHAYDDAPDESRVLRRAGYLLASRLSSAREYDEAADVLQPLYVNGHDDGLQPYIDAAFASAAAASGDGDTANEAWDRALESGAIQASLRISILRERASLAVASRDRDAATRWAAELTGLVSTSADRFLLAELAIAIDDMDLWEAQMRRVIADHPGTSHSVRAIEVLSNHGYDIDPADEGYVWYRLRQYTKAREKLAESLQAPDLTPDQLSFRTYYLAAAHEDDRLYAESIPLYDQAAQHAPQSIFAHRAQYWAARAAEALGDNTEAARRYAELVRTGPEGQFTAEARFRAGFLLLRAGDAQRAIDAWEALSVGDDGRVLYWKGRAYEQLGDSAAAHQAYEAALNNDPLSFHAMEAARRTGNPVADSVAFEPVEYVPEPDWTEIAAWMHPDGDVPVPVADIAAAEDFASIGLRARARQLVQEANGDPLARLRGAWQLGLTDMAAREATRILAESGQSPKSAPPSLVRLAYPVSYVSLLNSVGAKYNVDPLFLASLIRVESFWDPTARSHADAMGLTQVIPTTGEGIARSLGYHDWQVEHLFRPVISVEFGAYYISIQLRNFGNPHHALAAYNAGPGNAQRWAAGPNAHSPADFVESIDFNETQNYVPYVMSAYAHYRYAYREAD